MRLAKIFVALCFSAGLSVAAQTPMLHYEIVRTLPHDVRHYTQGLVLHEGRLLESVGQYGASALLEKELVSGRITREHKLGARFFGEGMTVFGKYILQLTWRESTGFIYDRELKPLGFFRYSGEGWGLTHDGAQLIMSDGTANLRMLNPKDFSERARIEVRDGMRPVPRLNELEYAKGHVLANVWLTNRIARIDPKTGQVVSWLDLSALNGRFRKPRGWNPHDHVLNGIAYDAASDLYYVTGKCWPVLFEIRIHE